MKTKSKYSILSFVSLIAGFGLNIYFKDMIFSIVGFILAILFYMKVIRSK